MGKSRKSWTHEEDKCLRKLIKKYGKKKWDEISDEICEISPQIKRSSQQCKERWEKHLNPRINKIGWSNKDVKLIFEKHHRFGNKWKDIAKQISNQFKIKIIDHTVKNQFFNCVRKSIRRICKDIGIENSTDKVRKIKPKILTCWTMKLSRQQYRLGEYTIYDLLLQFSKDELSSEVECQIQDNQFLEKLKILIDPIFSKNFKYVKQNRLRRSIKRIQKIKRMSLEVKQNKQVSIIESISSKTRFDPLQPSLLNNQKGKNKQEIFYQTQSINRCAADSQNVEEFQRCSPIQAPREMISYMDNDEINEYEFKSFSLFDSLLMSQSQQKVQNRDQERVTPWMINNNSSRWFQY